MREVAKHLNKVRFYRTNLGFVLWINALQDVANHFNLKTLFLQKHFGGFFLVKRVPGRGPEQRESEKTILYLQIIIILIIIYYY